MNHEEVIKKSCKKKTKVERMKCWSYYDGPVKDSGRTLEEIEKSIEKEKIRCEKAKRWEELEEDFKNFAINEKY